MVHLGALILLASWGVAAAVQNGLYLESPAAAPTEILAPLPVVVDPRVVESDDAIALSAAAPNAISEHEMLELTPLAVPALYEPGASDSKRHPVGDLQALLGGQGWNTSLPAASTTSTDGAERGAGADGGANFFGLKASGNRFVFVVDCSLSMEGAKWNEARQELASSINRLGPHQWFYVIFFDGETHRMFDDKEYEKGMLAATPENLDRLRQWLQTARLGYNTSPCTSVQYAVSLEPDAVFLLSDGEFTDPTAAWLRKNNLVRDSSGTKRPSVAIHTIGFHTPKSQKLLARIARENGGEFRYVP